MSLLNSENLLLIELDHVGQFSFFFTKFGILFLLLSELWSGIQQGFEVLLVALNLECVDLGQKLLFFLIKLGNFLLELSWVHAFLSHLVNILMSSLEFSLEILILLESDSHFFIN